MRSKIYNLKKSVRRFEGVVARMLKRQWLGGWTRWYFNICTKEQDDVAVKNRQQNVSLLYFRVRYSCRPCERTPIEWHCQKKETEGEKVKKNDLNFWESVSISKIFGQNSLQRQDREFAWIELKVDSSASAPLLAVINIYHFPSQARWKVNGLKMWKVDHHIL